ncbi:hypothetical protein ACI2K6_04145 [Microbacterium sp. NPDC006705]|uniref:hypothetical protein n=1 Tax=Microbacterium sp. NPDC006705 TaxID=3364181 RepID=UPI00384D9267
MLFDAGITLPIEVEFTVVGVDAGSGRGVLVSDAGRVLLTTAYRFSYTTGRSALRELRGSINGIPVRLSGSIWVKAGELGLLLSEVRLGSDELAPEYVSVRATYEHGRLASSYRFEDGAARSLNDPLTLPALGLARSMTLRYPVDDAVVIETADPAPLEEFDEHLAAWQDLLTFAEDQPIGRLALTAIDATGRTVTIHGHDRYPPFGKPARQPIEFVLRLAGTYAQEVLNGWWRARADLRPVPQVLAGTLYQPGFVESELIALAAVAEHTGRTLLPGAARPTHYRDVLRKIVAGLGMGIVQAAKVDAEDWGNHLLWARNDIAHQGAPDASRGSHYVTDAESRAVRDATRILTTLTLAQHIGVPANALARAAERLGVRYSVRHGDTSIFRR